MLRLPDTRDKTVIYALLKRLCQEDPQVVAAIDRAVDELNADYDALDEVLNLQHYRLAYWRTADQDLGYRRFFDINTLIGLRVERPHVFNATHSRILEWLRKGELDGVRVDHPDGLRDPEEYFDDCAPALRSLDRCGEDSAARGILRASWPIAGTTVTTF